MRRSWWVPFVIALAAVVAATALVAPVGPQPAARAAWPGDNGRIYFVCKITSVSQDDICSVEPDGSGLSNLTASAALRESQPAVSRDGSKVAFVRGIFADARVWVMNADGTGQVQVTQVPSDAPSFTPDGRISFRAQTGGLSFEFQIVSASGGSPTTLASATGSHRAPNWSADGSYVYSKLVDVGGNFTEQMFVVDGATERQVTTGDATSTSNSFGEISPDGQTIYYTRKFTIYKVSATGVGGAGEVQLTPTPSGELARDEFFLLPSPSPDGTRLVVQNNAAPNATSLYTLRTDGSQLQPLVIPGVAIASNPYWAPESGSSGPDTPSLSVSAPKQRTYTKPVPVTLRARGATYSLTLVGKVTVPKHDGAKKKTFRLKPVRVSVAPDQTRVVNLVVPKKARQAVAAALKAKKKPVLEISVKATPSASVKTLTVRLVR
jgi:TolB protein